MHENLDPSRLLAVIETQNEIAAMALDLDSVMEFVAERARALTWASASMIELPEGDEMVYRVGTGTAALHVGMRLKLDSSLSGLCAREQRVIYCEDSETDPRVDAEAARKIGARSMICVPLSHGDEIGGVLKVSAPTPNAFDDDDVATLGLLSSVIASHMAHATDYENAQRESREDELTRLRNRRAFTEDLETEVRVAERKRWPLALGLMDVNRFKQINDEHGHPAGDAVLAGIGAILAIGRAGDRSYRVGGDEFALIMPDTTADGARIAMARIVAMVGAAPVGGLPVSVSGGCAECGDRTADELYAAADASLYEAKADGRPESHAGSA